MIRTSEVQNNQFAPLIDDLETNLVGKKIKHSKRFGEEIKHFDLESDLVAKEIIHFKRVGKEIKYSNLKWNLT